jgi:DNA-binding response OmpR family regulator
MIPLFPHILVVSGNPELLKILHRVLARSGPRVMHMSDGQTLLARCEMDAPALVLLDLHSYGQASVELCREIRQRARIPILVSGTDEERDVLLAALDGGADDYLIAPFSANEVLLRIQTLIRRNQVQVQASDTQRIRCGRLEIDRHTMHVWRDGQAVRLTAKEWKLLEALVSHAGQILSHRMLLQRVWGAAYVEETTYLHTYINTLRRKIEENPSRPAYVLTEHGVGYRFALPPSTASQSSAHDAPLDQQVSLRPRRAPEAGNGGGRPQIPVLSHQLRAPITDFIGRAPQMQRLRDALLNVGQDGSAVTIAGVQGMGGVGKTELAYQVTHELRPAFPDGQLVLNLRGSSTSPLTPTQVLQAVIRAFTPDTKLPGDLEALQQHYRAVLHQRQMLIVADDARDAAQVRPLCPPPGCGLLVTSRQRFTLPGMTTIDLDQLSPDEAVTLLQGIYPRLSDDAAHIIARLCGFLPLALRISAGILYNDPALDVTTYIQRLADEGQRLEYLRDPDDPHLAVDASLALSYTLLDAGAQHVFRQLGVFAADFGTELARAVIAVEAGMDVEVLLRGLLRRNLVQYDVDRARWRVHVLVRDLARRELEKVGEASASAWRYAWAVVKKMQKIQAQYSAGGVTALSSLCWFDVQRAHIDAARRWAADHAGRPEGDALLLAYRQATAPIGLLHHGQRQVH